jgi:hypothetical protein
MINNQEKIEAVINRINNIEALKKSLIDNAEVCIDKYSLEEELGLCNAKKDALVQLLNSLGGSIEDLD